MADENNLPEPVSEHHKKLYQDMLDGEFQHAIASCIVDGVESSVISVVGRGDDGEFVVVPLFVAVTETMHLLGPDGSDLQKLLRDKPITWN